MVQNKYNLVLAVIFILVASAIVSADCDPAITTCPGTPNPLDPGNVDNYNDPQFYMQVSPDQWVWTNVNWAQVDLSRSDIYNYDGFYENLPADSYGEIDYTQVDYTKIDQINIKADKYFLDKKCTQCIISFGNQVPIAAGKDYFFSENGLEHSKGDFATIPGTYPPGSDFLISEDRILVELAEGVLNLDSQDSVGIYLFQSENSINVNGIEVVDGILSLNEGKPFLIKNDKLVIPRGTFSSKKDVPIFTDGLEHEGSYISFAEDIFRVKGNGINVEGWQSSRTDEGWLNMYIGGDKFPGEILIEEGDDSRLEAKGIFIIEDNLAVSALLGNVGQMYGTKPNSYLDVKVSSNEVGQGSGEFTARNHVVIEINGAESNRNPFANEGGGALEVYVKDMQVEVKNGPGKKTAITFKDINKKLSGASQADREQFLYDNTFVQTMSASNCDGEGECDLRVQKFQDFTTFSEEITKDKRSVSNRPSITPEASDKDPNSWSIPEAGDGFDGTSFLMQIEEGDKSIWGKGEAVLHYDGEGASIFPAGEEKIRFLEGLPPGRVAQAQKELDQLWLEGDKDTALQPYLENYAKGQLVKNYGAFKVTSPGTKTSSYQYRRILDELDLLNEYSGMDKADIAKRLKNIEIIFEDLEDALGNTQVHGEHREMRIDTNSFGQDRTTLPHEILHNVEYDDHYGDDPYNSPHSVVQRALLADVKYLEIGVKKGERQSWTTQGKIGNWQAGRGFNFEVIPVNPYAFTKRCEDGVCILDEFSTATLDYFSNPEQARRGLDKNDPTYKELGQKARKYLDEHKGQNYRSGEPEPSFYLSLWNAIEKPGNVAHPADFLSRSLGQQLVEGYMSPSYCTKNYGNSCGQGIQDYMKIVKEEYETGKSIPEEYYDERVTKANRIRNAMGDLGRFERATMIIKGEI
jgi:hypothetical protein